MKRATRSVVQVDWLLFIVRWLLLAGVVADIRLAPAAASINLAAAIALLVVVIVYNVILGLLLGANQWFTFMPLTVLVGDSLLAVVAFWALGWSPTVMVWTALFPAVTAALRFRWLSGAILALVVVAVEVVLFVLGNVSGNDQTTDVVAKLLAFIPNFAFLFALTLLTGMVSEQVKLIAIKRTHAERDLEEKRIRHVREQARVIYDMADLVSATLNYERVLDVALDRSLAVVADTGHAAAQLVSAAMLFRDAQLRVITARRFSPSDMKVALPAHTGVLAETVAGGDTVYSSEPYNDPELGSIVALRNCRSMMCIPLQAGMDMFGVVLFAHPRPEFFDLDHIELLEAICKHTIVALQNAKLYQKLLQEKERIVEVEEDARKKLARDLHDGPTQSVAAIAMRANYIRRLLEKEPKTAAEEIYKVEDLARKTTKEIRQMLFTLRPLVLESQGLAAALQQLAEKMKENYNLNVIVEAQQEAVDKLDIHAQGVLFYVAEEAVGNARKHAEAAHIWVRVKLPREDVAALEIQDDGVGFDVGAVTGSYDKRGSLGMVNMRERTELVNGAIKLESAPGRGTKITILVPLSDEAREKLGT
jgi:signal transduction histidine kinase